MTGPLFPPISLMTLAPKLTVVTVTITKNPDSLPTGVAKDVGSRSIAATMSVSIKNSINTGNVCPSENASPVLLLVPCVRRTR